MARLTLPIVPMTLVLAACGGGSSTAQATGTRARTAAAPPPRAAVTILSPAKSRTIDARPSGGGRLDAVLRIAGRAAPGQQLALSGSCGGYYCDGITFADSRGRWRTRIELVAPKTNRRVKLRVNYADATSGETPAAVVLRLRKAAPPPPAAPQKQPTSGGSSNGAAEGEGGTSSQPSGTTTGGQLAPYGGPRTMITIGDSLAVGMAPYLRSLLSDWTVSVDARTGRPLGEGMQVLAETPMPSGRAKDYTILAFSLFTNDSPTNLYALEAAVRESMGYLGRHGCALWATIARPPVNGQSFRNANALLYRLSNDPDLYGRLLIVPWAEEYARYKSWQQPDGVHATAQGYSGRAQLYAQTARACPA